MLVEHFSRKPWKDPPSKQPQFTPDASWDADKIRSTIGEHEEGYFYRSVLLGRWMTRDGRLSTTLETRGNGITSLPFCVEAPSESPNRRERKAAEALRLLWPRIMPRKTAVEVLESVVLHGFCLAQLVWIDDRNAPARWIPRVVPWNAQYCLYDQWREQWSIVKQDGLETITPGDGHWILFSSRDTMPWMGGLVRQLAIPILIRSFSWSDWSSFNETLGQTFLKGIIPSWANKTDDDDNGTPSKATFLSQIEGLGRDNRYLLCEVDAAGTSFDAKYESPDGEGSQSFEKAQANASTEITTRVLGQNLTTEVSGKGSYAATQGHEEVRQDYKEADSDILAYDLREQLIRPWALYNFGDSDLAPWAYYDPTPPADRKTNAETLKTLSESVSGLQAGLAGTGKQVDIEELYERFEVPLKEGERNTPEAAAPVMDPAEDRAWRNVVPWRRRLGLSSRPAHPQLNHGELP